MIRTEAVFIEAFGAGQVQRVPRVTASEDFSAFVDAGIASMLFIGVHDPRTIADAKLPGGKPLPFNHSPFFAPVPEPSLETGVEAMTLVVLNALSPTSGRGRPERPGLRVFWPVPHHTFARMSDPQPPSRQRESAVTTHPTLLARISALLMREPEDREQLLAMLHHAHERELLDADALSMIEGVMQVSELSARDIMVPRSQIDMIDIREKPEDLIPFVIETAHSRFPVIEEDRDHVIGILLAKDLLRFSAGEGIDGAVDIRKLLRPPIFIPESKRLNVLLRDFRANRNHVAIVVDEYGGVAGLITIEDVLEQIVGDIEDEYDFEEDDDNIVVIEPGAAGPRWRVRALTEIEQFNEYFETAFTNDQAETIGGVVTEHLGRVPRRGEEAIIGNVRFTVLRADARRVDVLRVEKLPTDEVNDDAG